MKLGKLEGKITAAQKALCDAVVLEFPLSSIVSVSHSRGSFDAQVVGHNGCYWAGAGEVKVLNLGSGIETWKDWSQLHFR